MMPNDHSTPVSPLEHLVKGYFYQLWDQYEYSTWSEAVDDFVARSPARAASVPAEIDQLRTTSRDDQQLTDLLDAWGFDHTPPEGVAAWLAAVRDRILNRPPH